MNPKLSIVVCAYNMPRELPRTIRSLSPVMQRDVRASDYEIIVVDNGSTKHFDEDECRRWGADLRITRVDPDCASCSPAHALNRGIAEARGGLVGVMIDGARLASPGLLSKAQAAARLHAKPMIGTIGFHLGPKVQMQSVREGYDQAAEDRLLAQSGWEEDGYRLFAISSLAGSSSGGWFELPNESNAVFLRPSHWRELGGFDERFATPGGGLLNLDTWSRICADREGELIVLLGEATFHQVHGGVATNSLDPPKRLFHDEYFRIRGRRFAKPTRQPLYFGSLSDALKPSLMTWDDCA